MIFLKFIAHRGLRTNKIKENTLLAFQKAIQSSFMSGFEFDVRETKDKQFIINHNAFIKDSLIKQKTLKELKKLYNILTLNEVLKLKTDKIMLLEVKDDQISYENFIKIISRYQSKNIYIMSFHNKVIRKLKTLNVPAKLGILNYVLNSEENYSYQFICLLNNLATSKMIHSFQKKGIEVFMYGVLNEDKDLLYENTYYIVNKEPIKITNKN